MKVTYDPKTDSLTVILKEGVVVAESNEDKPGSRQCHGKISTIRRRSLRP